MQRCKHCEAEIDIERALKEAPYSWPYLQSIWHICPECQTGNHLRFETDLIAIIEITGAPGPTWEYISKTPMKGIQISWEPEYFHVWVKGIEFVVEARKQIQA